MQDLAFEQLFTALSGLLLASCDLDRLRAWLSTLAHPGECLTLIEQAAGIPPCPRCHGKRVHRCGQASGLQRYRCLGCRRSYNALTGTPLARLRKREKWLAYLQCLLESRTVRDAATNVGVHRTTGFRWRHRFIKGVTQERPIRLSGIVEADETYLLESQKGSRHLTRPPRRRGGVAKRRGINREHECLLVARDRSGSTLDWHTGRGPVTVAQLETHLHPALPPDVLLISDAARAYRAFAIRHGIRHEAVNLSAGVRARGTVHIQNVNGWHSRFKTWLLRFRGVASRYLANYACWQDIGWGTLDRTGAVAACGGPVRQRQQRFTELTRTEPTGTAGWCEQPAVLRAIAPLLLFRRTRVDFGTARDYSGVEVPGVGAGGPRKRPRRPSRTAASHFGIVLEAICLLTAIATKPPQRARPASRKYATGSTSFSRLFSPSPVCMSATTFLSRSSRTRTSN